MIDGKDLIWLGGLIHFSILSASCLVPFVLDWKKELNPLSPFLRKLFWVYGVFIILIIVGFGTLSVRNAEYLANNDGFATAFCTFVAAFWTLRLFVQCFVFDTRQLQLALWVRLGYHSLTVAFVAMVAIYGGTALGLYR